MVDDTTPAAAEPQTNPENEDPNKKPVADDGATITDATAAEPDAKPAPGTPDKALQKMQQDLSATRRQMAELMAKVDSGQQLTPAEIEKARRGEERLTKIRSGLSAYGQQIEGGTELAEQILELTEDREILGAVAEGHDAIREQLDRQGVELAWLKAEKKYPNTDVHKVWEKACGDAEERVHRKWAGVWETMTPQQQRQAISGEANELYEERCGAVEAKARGTTANVAAATPNKKTPVGSTSGSIASGAGPAAGTVSPMAAQLARARRLVKTNQD